MAELGWSVEERVTRMEVQLANNTAVTSSLQASVNTLSENMHGRPSWSVVTYLTVSTMVNGALLTAVVALLNSRGR